MNTEKIKLIIKNIELLLGSLKVEICSDSLSEENGNKTSVIFDYDEVYSEG